ncbi:23S rRNA (adenine(2503)-C(2))-methyltransferase RlmN [Rivularia sp. UHCC 0363]|uniref:23S rRNA (adenine(2503)-C(2))-methyltransferase RlmN n=1 Tax=Rivularia sp. UHCC 0363 TaxID=3110244 RepID=UPI002B1EE7D2|nr:23S rRNA (adenine(2503)-C(2))-methyltransferase RlmN [Rivularia sp. UHCC 0363]MEA5595863.1 23S rRNA (adenine(2503)-C(2))-methyltransferase RlmN [Rivularia sp. UHCC 0363]
MSVNSVASSKPPVPQSPKLSIPPLLGASLSELTDWVQQHEQPAYRGKQLHQWIYQRGARSLSDITVFSKQWRESVAEISVGRSTLHHRSTAPDGTVKYLLELADGEVIETVGIPTFKKWGKNNRQAENSEDLERLTVCVSTQVGCPMACNFCATGKGGYKRNLGRHEIVDQVLTVQEDFGQRVSHIVFMGMGEPLLNVDHTLSAIQCLNKDVGIGQRNLTLSTVGIPGRIRHLAKHRLQITLAVSLHAPNQELREELIPSAHKYKIEELLAECRDYVEMTGRRVSFEYILLAGVNDLPEHAHQLSRQLRGFQSHVNLIPYNPIEESEYKRPPYDRIQAFVQALEKHHIAHSVRYSRGLEADAACGQLRAGKK